MQKTVTLKENRDFLRIYKKGKSYVSPAIVVYIIKNKKQCNRIGITTSKKIGPAVKRNRARRVIREAYRLLEPSAAVGYDIVFVARGKTVYLKTGDLTAALRNVFTGAGVLKR